MFLMVVSISSLSTVYNRSADFSGPRGTSRRGSGGGLEEGKDSLVNAYTE